MKRMTLILTLDVAFAVAASAIPSHARGGGAANLLNSPGYQRAQKEARDHYLAQVRASEQHAQPHRKRRHH